MHKLKKLVQKKYFYMIFFALLLIASSVVLYLTVSHDVQNSTITDDMIRVYGTVRDVYGHTEQDNEGNNKMQYDVILSIELSNGKKYEDYYINDVPKCSEGDKIKLKYDKDIDSVFYLANDPEPNYRIANYIIYISLMLIALAGFITASRLLDYLNHRRIAALNEIEKQKNASLDSHGIDYNSTETYNGYEGGENSDVDLNPFADNNIDYNALYTYDKRMNDKAYSADSPYTGYDPNFDNPGYSPYSPPETHNNSNNPMDASCNPNDVYTGYDN